MASAPPPDLARQRAEMEAQDDFDRTKGPDSLLRKMFGEFASHNCDELEYVDGTTLVMFILENMYSEPASPLPICMAKTINMSYLYPRDSGGNIDYLAGIFDASILRERIARLKTLGIKSYLPDATIEEWVKIYLDDNETAFDLNRKRFQECKFPYIFVPLTLRSFADHTRPHISGHQNGILIGKNGTVFRIEPDNRIEYAIDDKVNAGIIEIAEKKGLKYQRLIPIQQVCPQAIVKDSNCIFWTIFMCNEIIKNVFKYPNPNDLIKIYSSKPKEELEKIIKDFKVELVRKIIPEGLKKLGCGWSEFGRFNSLFPGYVGGKRRARKTKKKRHHKRRNKKSSKK